MLREQPREMAAVSPTSIASSSSEHERHDESPKNDLSKISSEPAYPSTSKVLVIIGGLFLCIFLVALDRLIIGVAIPRITDEFNSLGDIGFVLSIFRQIKLY